MPPGWRRLSPSEKHRVRALYLRAIRGDAAASKAISALYRLLRGKTRTEILGILEGAGQEYAIERVNDVRRAAGRTATTARSAAVESAVRAGPGRRLSGRLADRAAAWLEERTASTRESYRVSPIRGMSSARVSAEGDVWLSHNLHRANTRGVVDGLRRALIEGARHGEAASRIAQRIRDEAGHGVKISIPRQLRALEREAYAAMRASGDPKAAQQFESTRREFERYADKLKGTQAGTSAAANDALDKIVRAIQRNDAAAVDSAVKWWTWNREQEHQRMIARTEMSRAYSRAYVTGGKQIPWIVAWEWNTDDNPCEECQALEGRIMREGEVVYPPLHPNCECYLTEVVDSSKEPTEDEWEHLLDADE